MKEIIHIVGLNNEFKNDFVSKLLSINPNYNIIDIDDLTQKITNDKKIATLYDNYDKAKNDNPASGSRRIEEKKPLAALFGLPGRMQMVGRRMPMPSRKPRRE